MKNKIEITEDAQNYIGSLIKKDESAKAISGAWTPNIILTIIMIS